MNNALVAMGPTLMNLTSTSIVRIFANMSNATVAQQLRGTRECTACQAIAPRLRVDDLDRDLPLPNCGYLKIAPSRSRARRGQRQRCCVLFDHTMGTSCTPAAF